MQRNFPLFLICLLYVLPLPAQPKTGAAFHADHFFEENKGQVTGKDAPKVTYSYRNQDLSVFLMKTGIAYQFERIHYPEQYQHPSKGMTTAAREKMLDLQKQARTETYRMDMELIGANPQAVVTTEEPAAGYVNYYNRDVMQVRSYGKIIYHDIYPHIDWVIYKQEDHLKYDFAVRPGGNPANIRIRTRHVEDLELQPDGGLRMSCRMGKITEQKPVSYQDGREVATRFTNDDGTFSFEVAKYRSDRTLIIDPTLVWATYYGGSTVEMAHDCTTDRNGNVYIAGWTHSSTGIADGGHQNTIAGFGDAFLAKFNAAGIRQWATYYGGSGLEDGEACAADALGNVYLAGHTESDTGIASGGHQDVLAGMEDAYLVKFDAMGSRLWATYYGGSAMDFGEFCRTDLDGNVYLAGSTRSDTGIASAGAHQDTLAGDWDAFIVKFNAAGVRQWGTYFGGNSSDWGQGCATDTSGYVYLCGTTNSTSGVAWAGHQNSYGGFEDAFLARFNEYGSLQWATYYGGDSTELGAACATDVPGNVYLTGYTLSDNAIFHNGFKDTLGGTEDAFLVKFNASGTRLWGTYYGGNGRDYSESCTASEYGNVYMTGGTYSSSGIALGGYQDTLDGYLDAFLVKFDASGVRQWGTYYGGFSIAEEWGRSCAVDVDNVFIAGHTQAPSNIASGGHQNMFGGALDGFLVKFYDPCPPVLTITASDDSVCIGTPVTFTAVPANGGSAPSYQWKVNGVNAGTNALTYTYTPAYGDVVTCELSGPNACIVTSAASDPIALYVDTGAVVSVSITASPAVNVPPGYPVAYTASVVNASSYFLDWYVNGIYMVSTGSPNNTYVRNIGFTVDTVMAIIKPYNGCYNDTAYQSDSVAVSLAMSVPRLPGEPGVLVYPNPTNSHIQVIATAGSIRRLELLNVLGQRVAVLVQHNTDIDLSGLPAGIYQLRITLHRDGRDSVVVKKVEKR